MGTPLLHLLLPQCPPLRWNALSTSEQQGPGATVGTGADCRGAPTGHRPPNQTDPTGGHYGKASAWAEWWAVLAGVTKCSKEVDSRKGDWGRGSTNTPVSGPRVQEVGTRCPPRDNALDVSDETADCVVGFPEERCLPACTASLYSPSGILKWQESSLWLHLQNATGAMKS